jgi:hypothetical protein
MRARSMVIFLAAAAIAAACSQQRSDSKEQALSGRAAVGNATDASGGGARLAGAPVAIADMAPPPPPMAPRPESPEQDPAVSIAPSMVIRTGDARVKVTSVDTAIVRLQELARRVGGYVANSSSQGGERELRQATLELKVPAARFADAENGLAALGKVEYVNVTAQDVGEEFVDVTARVENARRLEQRLVGLLATRTGKLEEVLSVERELARVRETIERYEGRLRYLRTRVDVSTLTVTVHESEPLVGQLGTSNRIVEAFRAAWRNFVGFIAGFIESLGVLLPLALIGFIIARLAWRYRDRGPKRTPPPAGE